MLARQPVDHRRKQHEIDELGIELRPPPFPNDAQRLGSEHVLEGNIAQLENHILGEDELNRIGTG